MECTRERLTCLVVGAGPAGLTLSLLLTELGVRVLCVERRHEVSNLPRARGVHARAVEILRACGAEEPMRARELSIEPRMEQRSDLVSPVRHTVLSGGPELTEVSPVRGHRDLPGPLRVGAAGAGCRRWPPAPCAPGSRCSRPPGRRRRKDHPARPHHWRADRPGQPVSGGRGRVAERRCGPRLGIELDGPDQLGTARAVTFRADLRRWLGDPPPALVNLGGGSVLIADARRPRWVVNVPLRPGLPEAPVDLVRTTLGLPDLTVEVLTDSTWTAAAQTARQFSAGPVFLVGDAAHRVPPAGATGVSSAMADAHNLAWKIAAVCARLGASAPALHVRGGAPGGGPDHDPGRARPVASP